MTKREFFESVIRYACDGEDVINNVNANDLIAFAQKEIDKLDAQNIKRKEKPTKAQVENAELVQKMVEMFAGQSKVLAHDIAEKMDITTSKATALCKMAVKDGKATVDDAVVNKSVKKIYSFEQSNEGRKSLFSFYCELSEYFELFSTVIFRIV